MKYAKNMGENEIILITLSGRGDKDVAAIARYRGQDLKEMRRKSMSRIKEAF